MYGYLLYIYFLIREWNHARLRKRRINSFLKKYVYNSLLFDLQFLFDHRSKQFEKELIDLKNHEMDNHNTFIKHVHKNYYQVHHQIENIKKSLNHSPFDIVSKYSEYYNDLKIDFKDDIIVKSFENLFHEYENNLLKSILQCEKSTENVIGQTNELNQIVQKQNDKLDRLYMKLISKIKNKNSNQSHHINNKILLTVN